MRAAPLISIVVPCFNHGHFLPEALRSIVTPLAAEIVVIDDGCTDETPDILATFETTHAFRSIRQQNAGLAQARNRGMRESRGEYVVFLDADDRFVPGALDVAATALDDHPECAFVVGRCTMMDLDGTLLTTPAQPRIVRDHYRELLRRNYIWMPAQVMFRREAIERAGGFNPKVNAAADYELYLHIARHHPVHDHGAVVAHYRRHATNMNGNAGRALRETLAVLRSQRPFLEGDEASLAAHREGLRLWQEFYGSQLADEIRLAIHDGDWMAAAAKTAVLAECHPRGLWHHLTRKATRMLRKIEPEAHPALLSATQDFTPLPAASGTRKSHP